MDRDLKSKNQIGCGVTIITIIVTLAVILPLSIFILNWIAVSSMGRDARKDYEKTRTELIYELDSFINANQRLPIVLSEIGLPQNTLSYDIEGVYYVTLIPDDPYDTSYIIKFSYHSGQDEYYISKSREWLNTHNMQTPFIENDTLRKIDDIKLWLASDHIVSNIDSIRPNTSISFDFPIWADDSIVFIKRYDPQNGISMKGWAVSSGRFILFNEFGNWEYRDNDGNVYHKFWNYRKDDSLIYKPDPKPLFIKPHK